MKLSLRWLQRHVDLQGIEPKRILADLTMSTAEMEGMVEIGAGLDDIVVGHVVVRDKHPDADKLSVCQVDLGEASPSQIVCGAGNVAVGQKVAVIRPGATLPASGGKGALPIQRAKIRGVESLGMICSEQELGLSEAHDGILVLDPGLPAGARLVDVAPVRDQVLEIDNKSVNHRPDLWGHFGFARELAAIYGRELRPLPALPALPRTGVQVPVRIDDPKACPRYCGLVLQDVRAGASPVELRWLLAAVGQRPINLLVDLTNFVMLDLGQPMHAFDRTRLQGRGIVVRMARNGETLRTLDGQERRLTDQDLLICADDEPVALAGVMGGAGTMIEAGTADLFLESASFHATTIRRTSMRLGLRTDASARFEKAQDPRNAELALGVFWHELHRLCPSARIAGPLSDPAGFDYQPKPIPLRRSRLDLKLGHHVPDAQVQSILGALQFEVAPAADGFTVRPPSFRATKDIAIEDDLIEEVGRMFRYDNIPAVPLRSVVMVPPREDELFLARRAVEVATAELHFCEAYNYSFTTEALVAGTGAAGQPHLRVKNPVAPEAARIRRHVLPSLLPDVRQNLRHFAEVRLLEHGKGYHPEHRDADRLPAEVRELALVWSRREGADPYFELREGLLVLLQRLGCAATIEARHDGQGLPWVHPGRTAAISRGGAVVGYVGRLHPNAERALELPAATAIASLDLRALLGQGRQTAAYRPLAVYPAFPVDVALLAPEAVQVAAVAGMLRQAAPELVQDVTLFEAWRGTGVPAGHKSLNFTVVLLAADRTLNDQDAARYITAVRERAAGLGCELRG